MQTVWIFGDAADIVAQVPEPYIAGYLTYGGSAYGNETSCPTVNHHFS
jgi:L-ascorbate oxidase